MEYSSPCYSAYDQSNSWSDWPNISSSRPFPSQYISRQNSQSSTDSAALYSQYASSYAYTCPLPQAESPYHHRMPQTVQKRPKSMSWPRGLFPPHPEVFDCTRQSSVTGDFYHGYEDQQAVDIVGEPKSITPRPQDLTAMPEDPDSTLSAALYGYHAVSSPSQRLRVTSAQTH